MNVIKTQQKGIKEQAAEELRDEIVKAAKDRMKTKLRDLHKARQVVANLEREVEDLEAEIQVQINEL